MKLKKISCFLLASIFTIVMGTTVFAQKVPSDYNAFVTSESVYGPGNYDENNYFHFASRDRMSSAGDFYFSLEYTLKSDNFWIKNSW